MSNRTKSLLADGLEFAERLNRTLVNGVPLGDRKVLNRFTFTPFFTTSLTFAHGRARTSKHVPVRRSNLTTVHLLVISLLSLTSTFFKRPHVLIYSIDKVSADNDHDFRLHAVYSFLRERGISHAECLHTILFESFIPNLRARGRWVMYMEALTVLFDFSQKFIRSPRPDINLSLFREDEQKEASRAVLARLRQLKETEFQIRFWRVVLQLLRPRAVFAIDDMRQSAVLTAAAELAGIPAYWFQHGHYTKFHLGYFSETSGTPPMPTSVLVWSRYWKDELIKLGTYIPEERIRIGGVARPLPQIRKEFVNETSELAVLIPYETAADKSLVSQYIEKMLEDQEVRIYFKMRNDMDTQIQMDEYGIKESDRVHCVIDHEPYVEEIDVVVGTYSTFLYDMIAYGIPVALLETGSEFGERMIINGLAQQVARGGDCVAQLRKIADISDSSRAEKRRYLFGDEPVLLNETLEAIAKELSILRN